MLVNLIGFSFLCGIGIGCIIVLVLVLLRRATEQRIKWAILGSTFVTTVVSIATTVYVMLLPTPDKQIRSHLDMVPNPSYSLQLFEHDYIVSSATGNCSSAVLDRWFGLDVSSDEQMLIDW